MQAWRVHEWGEPETMILEEAPMPPVGSSEVRIRNFSAALNFFDVLQIQGKYQIKPPFPFIPGAEVAGIIDAVGDGVTEFRAGDRVISMTRGNGFAQYSSIAESRVFPMPSAMSFEEGAALPVAYHTSYFALKQRGALQPGEVVLVHAGASGVGVAAIQLARVSGNRVLATAGGAAKCEFARAQGADQVFDYTDSNWIESVREATGGRGADVIYDPVGGDVFDLSLKCIAPEGRLLVVGFASGRIPSVPANRLLLKNASLVGVLWGNYVQAHPSYPKIVHAELMEMYVKGAIRPSVGAVYAFEDAPNGLRDLANRKVMGKAVLSQIP